MSVGLLDVVKNFGDFPASGMVPHVSQLSYLGQEGARNGTDFYDTAYNDGRVDERGYRQVRSIRERSYERRLMEASRLIRRAFEGDSYAILDLQHAMRGRGRFVEALSISDFPNLFGDIIDRAVLANYRETPYTWNLVANKATVADFRQVKRFRIDYGTKAPTVAIEMGGPYPEEKIADNAAAGTTGQASGTPNTAGYYAYNIQKYGKRMPFFWETMINDDLNAIKDVPARFGRAMRRGEERFVTNLYANNTTFFSAANFKNTVVAANAGGPYTADNPPLSITALAEAMTVMANQRDLDGEPIEIEAVVLVVPPALKVTAQNILNADYFWANELGGTVLPTTAAPTASGTRLNVANWARNVVKLAVNYYLPIVDATHGATGWYLFAEPAGGRPALEFGHLRGHETPELFMKLPNSVAISEGGMGPGPGPAMGTQNMNPIEGDFDTDSIHYKIRHCWGGVTIDPLMAAYSNGSGS